MDNHDEWRAAHSEPPFPHRGQLTMWNGYHWVVADWSSVGRVVERCRAEKNGGAPARHPATSDPGPVSIKPIRGAGYGIGPCLVTLKQALDQPRVALQPFRQTARRYPGGGHIRP